MHAYTWQLAVIIYGKDFAKCNSSRIADAADLTEERYTELLQYDNSLMFSDVRNKFRRFFIYAQGSKMNVEEFSEVIIDWMKHGIGVSTLTEPVKEVTLSKNTYDSKMKKYVEQSRESLLEKYPRFGCGWAFWEEALLQLAIKLSIEATLKQTLPRFLRRSPAACWRKVLELYYVAPTNAMVKEFELIQKYGMEAYADSHVNNTPLEAIKVEKEIVPAHTPKEVTAEIQYVLVSFAKKGKDTTVIFNKDSAGWKFEYAGLMASLTKRGVPYKTFVAAEAKVDIKVDISPKEDTIEINSNK